MNPLVAVAIALVVGAGLGALIVWRRLRGSAASADPLPERAPVVVPEDVAQVRAAVRSSTVVLGPDDVVLHASPQARTLGLVRGSRVTSNELLDLVDTVRRDHEITDADLRVGPIGRNTYLSARVAPIGADLVLVLADDTTAERRVEDTRRDFVANVSHELKTPIGAVSLLAEALEDSPDDPDAVRRFASRLGVESRRLSMLVGQIIDLSRLQGDDPLAEAEAVDVDRLLAAAVDLRRVDAERRGVTLTLAGESGLAVLGSRRQLTTAIGNLVENAVVYSDAGARVAVAAHRRAVGEDDSVEITVSDNGIGIAAADLERIFERFYRVDFARSRDNGGTGLGLSIVKHVASAHRGEVAVWSQPGRGSTFTIRLPMHQVRASETTPAALPDVAIGVPPSADLEPVPARRQPAPRESAPPRSAHHQPAQRQSAQRQSAQRQSAQGQSAQGQSAQGESAQRQESIR